MSTSSDMNILEEALVDSAGLQRINLLWQLARCNQETDIQHAFSLGWEAYHLYMSLLSPGDILDAQYDGAIDTEHLVSFLHFIANIAVRSGYFEEAYAALESCLYYSRKGEYWSYYAKALNTMGMFALNRTADPVQALEYFTEARQYTKKGTKEEGFLLANTSRVYMTEGDYPKALEYLEHALAVFRDTNTPNGEIQVLQCMGRLYCNTGDSEKALHVLLHSLSMQEAERDNSHIPRTHVYIGNVYFALGDYTEALHYQLQALHRYEALNDRQGVSTALSNIGNVYNHLQEYESALAHYQKALVYKQQLRERPEEALLLNNMGNVYSQLQQYESAHTCLAESLELFEIGNDPSGIAAALTNTGRVYLQEKHYDKACHCFQKALAIMRSIGEKREEVECLLALGHLSLVVDHIPQAIQWLEEALALATNIAAKSQLWQIHQSLAHTYEQAGNAEKALLHHRAFYQVKEQLFNEESNKRMRVLQLRYKVEETKKEAEVQRMRREQLEQEMEIKNRELTATTMLLAQKNKILQELYLQVQGLRRASGKEQTEKIQSLLLLLEEQLGERHIWDVFEQHFTQVHSSFYENLLQLCSSLSPTELKVCALIKLNLSMKESAALLAVTDMTVKKHRYNIRKKLSLGEGESLTNFLAVL